MIEGTPHRIVDGIAKGIAGGARNFITAAASGVKGAGEAIMRGLDGPFTQVTGKEGPHRIADRLADGAIDAGVHFLDSGIIGTAEKAGEAIMRALDHFPEQTGLPPKIPRLRK